jgi:hypothetical protein
MSLGGAEAESRRVSDVSDRLGTRRGRPTAPRASPPGDVPRATDRRLVVKYVRVRRPASATTEAAPGNTPGPRLTHSGQRSAHTAPRAPSEPRGGPQALEAAGAKFGPGSTRRAAPRGSRPSRGFAEDFPSSATYARDLLVDPHETERHVPPAGPNTPRRCNDAVLRRARPRAASPALARPSGDAADVASGVVRLTSRRHFASRTRTWPTGPTRSNEHDPEASDHADAAGIGPVAGVHGDLRRAGEKVVDDPAASHGVQPSARPRDDAGACAAPSSCSPFVPAAETHSTARRLPIGADRASYRTSRQRRV